MMTNLKVNRFSKFSKIGIPLFMMAASCFFSEGHASTETGKSTDAERIQIQSTLAEIISRQFQAALATALDRSLYEVEVQVVVAEKPVVKVEKVVPIIPNQNDGVGGYQFFAPEAIIKNYEKMDFNGTADVKLPTSLLSQYTVKAIHLTVGFSEALEKSYVEKMKTWLQVQASKEFGDRASVEIQTIKAKPAIGPNDSKFLKFVGGLQNLFGLILFSLAMVISAIIWLSSNAKQQEENRKMALLIHQTPPKAPPKMLTTRDETKPPGIFGEEPANINLNLEVREIQSLLAKIGQILDETGGNVEEVMTAWFETGERGFYKFALLADAVNTFNGSQEPEKKILWRIHVPDNKRRALQTSFKKMSLMPIPVKRKLLDEVYWDLAGLRYLGVQSISVPFGFMVPDRSSEIKGLLERQAPEVKALAILHMPPEVQNEVIGQMEQDQKKSLLLKALSLDRVSAADIEKVSDQLRGQVKQQSTIENFVPIQPMVYKLMASLPVLDEMEFLRDIDTTLPDQAQAVRSHFPSLAFINLYPEEKLKLLLGHATSEEVTALLRLRPVWRDQILPLCKPMVSAISSAEIGREDKTSDELKNQRINSLKEKLLVLIDQGLINTEHIFKTGLKVHDGQITNAA